MSAAEVFDSDRFDRALHPRENLHLFGHEDAEQHLLALYRQGKMPQALILGGPEGIGKATLAWRLTRFLLAHSDPKAAEVQNAVDLQVPENHRVSHLIKARAHSDALSLRREYNDKTGKFFTDIRIDQIRQIIHSFQMSTGEEGWRICILDHAGELNRSGANALLKSIEEPPPRSLFIIISHRPGQILPTIRSRCQMLMLKPLSQEAIICVLKAMPAEMMAGTRMEAQAAAKAAGGSVRQALRHLWGEKGDSSDVLRHIMAGLPKLDREAVGKLASMLAGRNNDEAFAQFVQDFLQALDQRLWQLAENGTALGTLDRLAQFYQDAIAQIAECDNLNLDRRALIVTLMTRLSQV